MFINKVLVAMDFSRFSCSTFLGQRAKNVYDWFLQSLHLSGDVAECGVFRGETSRELLRYLEENNIQKTLHMFDTFKGLPDIITVEEMATATGKLLRKSQFSCSLKTVVKQMKGLHQFVIHRGLFSITFTNFVENLCFIHADADLYLSTLDIIHLADKCLVPGGNIVFDDYNNPETPGVKLAIESNLNPNDYIILPSPSTIQCFATKR